MKRTHWAKLRSHLTLLSEIPTMAITTVGAAQKRRQWRTRSSKASNQTLADFIALYAITK